MATMVARWSPSVLLGVVVAALVVATAQAATVTIYNPAGLVVDIQNDDKNVKSIQRQKDAVITAVMADLEISQAQQVLKFSVAGGEAVDMTVHDGDAVVVIPDPAGASSSNAIKALKVLSVQSDSVVPKPSVASIPQYDTHVVPPSPHQ